MKIKKLIQLFFVVSLFLFVFGITHKVEASTFYQNNFDTETTNTLPTGWVNLGGATWKVGTSAPISGTKNLEDPVFNVAGISLYMGTSSVANSTVRLSQKVNINGSFQGANSAVFLRLSSDGNDGYLFAPDFSTNGPNALTVSLFKKVGGNYTQLNQTSMGRAWVNGDIAILKAEVEGTTIRWKVWKSIESEPAGWTYSTTDSSVSAAGYIGLFEGYNNGGEGGAISAIDDIYWGDVGSTFGSVPQATSFTLSGPSFGVVNATSTNFTITPNAQYTGSITPSTSGSGVFSPTSLNFSSSSVPQTFTYTPTSTTSSPHTISASANPTLTNASGTISYTVISASSTIFYQNNFDTETTGTLPTGWVNISTADWKVGTTSPVSGAKSLGDSTYEGFEIAVYTNQASTSNSTGQISQKVQLNGNNEGANVGLYLRIDNAAQNGYLFAPDFNTNKMFIFKKNSSTYTAINAPGGTSFGRSFSNNETAILKAEVIGTTLRWKIWKSSESEPGTWTESISDSTITGPGYIGVFSGNNNTTNGSTTSNFDDIFWGSVGSTFSSASEATNFTLTGPTSGSLNSPSSNFTITPNGIYRGTISLSSSGSGTFSTSSLIFASSSTSQTFTYTPTSTTSSPHTISAIASPTLANVSGSISYTVNPGVTIIAVDNTSWAAGRSPYNWYVSGSSYMQAVNPGAYFRLKFNGTSASLGVDVSAISGAGVAAKKYPRIRYRIDGGSWQTYQLVSGDSQVSLASSLTDSTHDLEVYFLSSDAYSSRWDGVMSLKITGLTIDVGRSLSNATLLPKKMLSFGDSITEGAWILGNTTDLTNYSLYEDSTLSYIKGVASDLNAEYGTAAFGGQGWDTPWNSDVPAFPNAWNYYFSSHSRLSGGLLSPVPDYVTVNMGTNGGVSSASTVSNWLTSLRAATGPSTKIFVIVPFRGDGRANITSGFNSYKTASSDANVFLIDLGSDGTTYTAAPTYSYDGAHPNTAGNAQLRTLVSAAILSDLGDITPPLISNITSISSETSALITWTTNENASSTVNFGLNSSYGFASSSQTLVINHSIILSGLTPSTTYHFNVGSSDTSSNLATSTDYTFTTIATPVVTPSTPTSTSPSGSTRSSRRHVVINGIVQTGEVVTTVTTSNQTTEGCLPGYNFSPLTGMKCSTTVSTPTSPSSYTFTRDLTLGSEGDDVKQLQMYLNTHGFSLAASGVGSQGFETTTFGALTKAALSRFQAAKGISPAVGYFGVITRQHINNY